MKVEVELKRRKWYISIDDAFSPLFPANITIEMLRKLEYVDVNWRTKGSLIRLELRSLVLL